MALIKGREFSLQDVFPACPLLDLKKNLFVVLSLKKGLFFSLYFC